MFCKKYLLEVGPSDLMEAGGLRRCQIRPACARQDNLFCKKYLLGPSDLIEAGELRMPNPAVRSSLAIGKAVLRKLIEAGGLK